MDRLANREKIGLLLQQGLEHKEIAAEVDCAVPTVAKVARELGLRTRRNKQYVTLSDKDWARLLADVEGGMSITEAHNKYKVSRAAIYARRNK